MKKIIISNSIANTLSRSSIAIDKCSENNQIDINKLKKWYPVGYHFFIFILAWF